MAAERVDRAVDQAIDDEVVEARGDQREARTRRTSCPSITRLARTTAAAAGMATAADLAVRGGAFGMAAGP